MIDQIAEQVTIQEVFEAILSLYRVTYIAEAMSPSRDIADLRELRAIFDYQVETIIELYREEFYL